MNNLNMTDLSDNKNIVVETIVKDIVNEKKERITFKQRYADPEFKKKHLEHMQQDVMCPNCKSYVKKYNLSHHHRSLKHMRNVKEQIESRDYLKEKTRMEVKILIERLARYL